MKSYKDLISFHLFNFIQSNFEDLILVCTLVGMSVYMYIYILCGLA